MVAEQQGLRVLLHFCRYRYGCDPCRPDIDQQLHPLQMCLCHCLLQAHSHIYRFTHAIDLLPGSGNNGDRVRTQAARAGITGGRCATIDLMPARESFPKGCSDCPSWKQYRSARYRRQWSSVRTKQSAEQILTGVCPEPDQVIEIGQCYRHFARQLRCHVTDSPFGQLPVGSGSCPVGCRDSAPSSWSGCPVRSGWHPTVGFHSEPDRSDWSDCPVRLG